MHSVLLMLTSLTSAGLVYAAASRSAYDDNYAQDRAEIEDLLGR